MEDKRIERRRRLVLGRRRRSEDKRKRRVGAVGVVRSQMIAADRVK